jgi:L-alanine-DL-glutamate epimerase-like enolase superfamily enzyme
MSKVERIELYHVDIPLKDPFYPSWIPGYPQTHNRFTLIKLFSSDGAVGYGAGNAFSRERQGLGDLLGGFLLGIEVGDIETVRMRLREASYLGWRNWWIEAAFWDLWAKEKNLPAYKLMADSDISVTEAKIYASTGEVRSFEKRKPYLDEIRDKGISAVKIRVHSQDEKEDIRILKQVRKELGDDFIIGVDANQGWPVSLIDKTHIWDLDRAVRFGKECDDLGLDWIEEPLDMHAFDDYGTLRKKIKTKLAGCELHGDISEVKGMFEHDSLDKYQPDSTFSGISVARFTMNECRKRGLAYSPHTWTNGVGFMINLQCFAAWGGGGLLEFPYDPPGWIPAFREGIIPPVDLPRGGMIKVPQTPGFGIEIIKKKLKKYGTRFALITPLRLAVTTLREKGIGTTLELLKKKRGK